MTAKTVAVAAIATARAAITTLETSDAMTVAEIERLVGDVRTELSTAIDGLETTYGIEGYAAITAVRKLAESLQELGARVIDAGSILAEWTSQSDVSAMAVAHWLYGDVDRADEIVRLNGLVNPSRIPPGTVLKVRSA